jgi:hypothetical protein
MKRNKRTTQIVKYGSKRALRGEKWDFGQKGEDCLLVIGDLCFYEEGIGDSKCKRGRFSFEM